MYGFNISVPGTLQQVEERVRAELQKEGFGVLTEIDVAATLKKKLGIERRPYRILGACNPPLAHQAIEADPDIGSITVGFMDPAAVLKLVERADIEALAVEVRGRLERVRDALLA